jgi:essential nuclear protein 1
MPDTTAVNKARKKKSLKSGKSGKAKKSLKSKKSRRSPLVDVVSADRDTAAFKVTKPWKAKKLGLNDDERESREAQAEEKDNQVMYEVVTEAMQEGNEDVSFVPPDISRKILEQSAAQRDEEEQRGVNQWASMASSSSTSTSSSSSSAFPPLSTSSAAHKNNSHSHSSIKLKVSAESDDEDLQDDDDNNNALDQLTEDDLAREISVSAEEEKLLEMFMPGYGQQKQGMSLADKLMEKLAERDAKSGGGGNMDQDVRDGGSDAVMAQDPRLTYAPEVVEVYASVGRYLSRYTSGKIPKAFKIIPSLRKWEEVLYLTSPDKWSHQAMFAATRLFSSNLNPLMAQRFYNIILLPRVREDIESNKKLNFHLYKSVMKSIYKPSAFFKGILLPLAEWGCTPREAIIMSSVLSKCSIPVPQSAVALLRLSKYPYSGATTLFMKTILNKKYSLPKMVVDSMVDYFYKFKQDDRFLPTIWHQNLLTFVQRYKTSLKPSQCQRIKDLIKRHTHEGITQEVKRELNAMQDSAAMDL